MFIIKFDIQSQIREIVNEKILESSSKPNNSTNLTQNLIIQEIIKKGLADAVSNSMNFESKVHQSIHEKPTRLVPDNHKLKATPNFVDKNQELVVPIADKVNIDPSKRHLYLQILNGRAFLEYLNENDNEDILLPGHQAQTAYFNIYVHFRGQRFKTRAFGCACDPVINEGFLLEMHKDRQVSNDPSMMADSAILLSICDPIHIVMIRTDLNQETHLISSHFLEWRTVLTMPNCKQNLSIELMGTGAETRVPAGLLNICLQLIPTLNEPLREDIFGAQLGLEHSKNTERVSFK